MRLALPLLLGPVLGTGALRSPDPDHAKIDAIFAQYDHTNSPGCALGVYRDGRIVYSRGYGMADLNQGIAITSATPFYIASTSKQFTAFSVALAAEQGRLSLDDPIRKFIPELPAYAEAITVRHLVHHLSGIRDYLGLWSVSGRSFADQVPEAVALDLITRQKQLDFGPGTEWSYSNSGYFLLSVIVHRATGLSLRQFAEKNLFGPLGMTATHFHDDQNEIVSHRAEGYQAKPTGGFEIVKTSFALVGDGGLYTTVDDLLKWDSNFYANRLGSRGQALIDQVLTKGRFNNGEESRYAFGLFPSSYRGLATVDHGGAFIGYRAELLRFPSEKFSVAVLCNEGSAATEAMAHQVADLYLADRLGPIEGTATAAGTAAVSTVPAAKLDRYLGRYELGPGMIVAIGRAGTGIEASAFGQKFPLAAQTDSTFAGNGPLGTLEFRIGPSGEVTLYSKQLSIGGPGKKFAEAPVLDAAGLAGYTGRYSSDELDTWATIEVKDGALMLRSRLGPWTKMEPLTVDGFIVNGARLAFDRGAGRAITGFRLSAGRLANVGFSRIPPKTSR